MQIENVKYPADKMFVAKYSMISFFIFLLGFMLLKYPVISAEGIRNGINLSVDILIPTLFPFIVVSELIANTGILNRLPSFISRLTKVLFQQPPQALTVFLMSILGGYPIGPSLIKKLYEKKEISYEQAQRLLIFCIAPGPAFVLSTVGIGMLNSQKTGLIIYISVITASFILGILSRFLKKNSFSLNETASKQYIRVDFSQAFVESIDRAAKSMISICVWVIFFCCVTELLNIILSDAYIKKLLICVCEVTTACKNLSSEASIPAVAAIISFAGFAVHFQVMPCIIKIKMKMMHFFFSRIIHSIISYVVCHILLKFLPESVSVISVGVKPDTVNLCNGISLSFVLFVLSCLVLLGDNIVIKMKSTKT